MENCFENPFAKARKALHLSVNDFSALIGIGTATTLLLEKGAIKNPKIPIQKLSELGYDATVIKEEYTQWRQFQQEQARAKILSQKGE